MSKWINGTGSTIVNVIIRMVPKVEVNAVTKSLEDILSCEVDRWPAQSLTHVFWYKFDKPPTSCDDFVHCIKHHNLTSSANCHLTTAQYCGRRFGEQSPERLEECHQLLTDDKYRQGHPEVKIKQMFNQHLECTWRTRKQVVDCWPDDRLDIEQQALSTAQHFWCTTTLAFITL